MVVYVDDFKLAGPAKAIKKGWDLIRKGIKTDNPSPLGMYLGCWQDVSERKLPDTGAKVRVIEYNVEDFLRSCVERYKELTGVRFSVALQRRFSRKLPIQTSPTLR